MAEKSKAQKAFDNFLGLIITFLVRSLLAPKVYFQDRTVKKAKQAIKEPSIIVCNHTGHLDGPCINVVVRPHKVHSLAAKDRFEQPNFGFWLRHTGCIPIDRQNADTSWIHESLRVLRVEKENVAIYPEGRHGQHRQQLPFHSGVTMLAVMAQAPIVMVYMDGPMRFFHRNGVIIGEPFRIAMPATGLSADFVDEQTHVLEQKMKDLMQDFIEQHDR